MIVCRLAAAVARLALQLARAAVLLGEQQRWLCALLQLSSLRCAVVSSSSRRRNVRQSKDVDAGVSGRSALASDDSGACCPVQPLLAVCVQVRLELGQRSCRAS